MTKAQNSSDVSISRRSFLAAAGAGLAAGSLRVPSARAHETFSLRYILASAMYGTMPLATILAEVKETGSEAIDIWPRVHGNQREQIDEMGRSAFAELLLAENVRVGCITCYNPGPFKLASEIDLVRDLGQKEVLLVTGAPGPKGLSGTELRKAIHSFIEKMKPTIDAAAKAGCSIAIENHVNSTLESPDAIRMFGELAPRGPFGLALAPHHLPQDPALIAGLIRDLGPVVQFFYAQQHGKGSKDKLPKEEELLQMPGRGPLDFGPIVAALADIQYAGYTEIFMHPVPRGVPILDTADAITAEINASRKYLDKLAQK
jgi:sugar phosphate isomerase/epimerase